MGAKYEKLMASMQAELDGSKPDETTTTNTTTQAEDTVVDTPPAEDDKGTPGPDDGKSADDKPADTPPDDDRHDGKPADDKPTEHRDIPEDPVKRAEFAFRRQLGKQKDKYEAELKNRDEKYEKLAKDFEELKKRIPEPEKEKLTRDKFGDDEDFIHALNKEDFEKFKSQWEEENRKKAEEREQADKKRQQEEDELRQEQAAWLRNVDEAFANDKARSNKFLSDIQYANEHGLGEILDNCPVASDYLMHDPMGPVVFDKVIHDKETFNRVFDMRRLTPMNIFYQLKKVEEELTSPAPAVTEPAPAPAKPTMPHLGKPGRQAASSSMTNNDMFSDPKAVKKWLREQRR